MRGHTPSKKKKKTQARTWRLHLHLFRGDFLLFHLGTREKRDAKRREDVGGSRLPPKKVQTIHKNHQSPRANPCCVWLCARDQTSSLRTTARRKDAEIKEEECDNAALRDEMSRGGRARVAERIVERHRVNVIERCVPQKERDIDVVQNVIVVIVVVVVVQQGGEEGGEATRRWKIAPERHRGRA